MQLPHRWRSCSAQHCRKCNGWVAGQSSVPLRLNQWRLLVNDVFKRREIVRDASVQIWNLELTSDSRDNLLSLLAGAQNFSAHASAYRQYMLVPIGSTEAVERSGQE